MNKWLKISLIVLSSLIGFILLVLLFGTLFGGCVAKNYVNNHTEDILGRRGSVEHVDMNLFTGHVAVNGLAIYEDNGTDKFAGFESSVKRSENGILYVTAGTNAFISAKVEQMLDLGSHTLFIAAVEDMDALSDVPSTTYDYYQKNIKPKPEEKKEKTGKTIWRCTICGYEYEGEELPADYICPICKHPASDFEKVIV